MAGETISHFIVHASSLARPVGGRKAHFLSFSVCLLCSGCFVTSFILSFPSVMAGGHPGTPGSTGPVVLRELYSVSSK